MALKELSKESRQDFIPSLLDWLDELDPAVLINWDTSDQFPSTDGKFLDIKKVLYNELIKRLETKWEQESAEWWYDLILEYDPARNTVFFWDEAAWFKDEDRYMREELLKLEIEIKDANDNNLVPSLLNTNTVKSASWWMLPDKVFLQMVERIIWEKWKKVCIVIDKANLFIHQEWNNSIWPERIFNESIVIDLINYLRENKWSHFVLIDRNDCLNWDLRKEIPFIEVPAITRSDIEGLLEWAIDLNKYPQLLNFSNWMRVRTIRGIVRDAKKKWWDVEKSILDTFSEAKIQEMNRALQGTAEIMEVTFDENQIHMPEPIMNELDLIIRELSSWSEFIHQWWVFPWPPWTWKTAVAQYIAYKCWIPFFKLADIWSEKFRWNTEKKLRILKSVLSNNRPCILFVDEISDIWWKSSWEINSSWGKDDAEVNRLLKEMLWSPEMQWVFIIWACNDLDKMDPAMYRRGWRLEDIIPILPPTSLEARKKTFIAIWNQFSSLKWMKLDDAFLDFVASQWDFVKVVDSEWNNYWTYSEVTWADYKSIIQRAWRMSNDKDNPKSVQENVLKVFASIPLKKDKDFYDRIISAIKLWNRFDLMPQDKASEEDKEFIASLALFLPKEILDYLAKTNIDEAMALVRMKEDAEKNARLVKNLEIKKQELEKQILALKSESLDLQWELDNIQEQMDSRVKIATKEERTKMAKKLQNIRSRLRWIQTQEQALQSQAQTLETKEAELNTKDWELTELQKQLTQQASNISNQLHSARDQLGVNSIVGTKQEQKLEEDIVPWIKRNAIVELKGKRWKVLRLGAELAGDCWSAQWRLIIQMDWEKFTHCFWCKTRADMINKGFIFINDKPNTEIPDDIFKEHYSHLIWWRDKLKEIFSWGTIRYPWRSNDIFNFNTSNEACNKFWFSAWDVIDFDHWKWVVIWVWIGNSEWDWNLWCHLFKYPIGASYGSWRSISNDNYRTIFSPRWQVPEPTQRTFNLNVQNLWAEATERANRLFWEIEQVTWDRLVSILRFNDILQEIWNGHIPVEHMEELIMRHDPEYLSVFIADVRKIQENCEWNSMPLVNFFPQVWVQWGGQDTFNLMKFYNYVNWARDWNSWIQKMWYADQWIPTNLLNSQNDWIMRAYSSTCLNWSKSTWYSKEIFDRKWSWSIPDKFQISNQWIIWVQEQLLWKWFEINQWFWWAWSLRSLDTHLRWDKQVLLTSDYMHLDVLDKDNDPVHSHTYSGGDFWLNWSHGEPGSIWGIGASQGFPWIENN